MMIYNLEIVKRQMSREITITRFLKLSTVLIFSIVVWIGCDSNQNPNQKPKLLSDTKIEKKNSVSILRAKQKISSIQLYCWCFSLYTFLDSTKYEADAPLDFVNVNLNICHTPTNVPITSICKKDNLALTLNTDEEIQVFSNSIASSNYEKIKENITTDARLGIVISYENGMKDTLDYFNERHIVKNRDLLSSSINFDSILYSAIPSFDFNCPSS